jgi:hypothetical protein
MTAVLLVAHVGNIARKMVGCLHRAGYEVDVLSIGRQTLGLGRSRFVRRFDAIDATGRGVPQAEDISRWIASSEPSRRWVAVLGDDLQSHQLLHGIAPHVRTPVFAPTSPERLAALYDKWSFYRLVADVPGVRTPPSALLAAADADATAIAATIGFPLLVKPLTGEGGHGIAIVRDEHELRGHLAHRDADDFPLKLQRFIRGPTLGLSLLAAEGRILASDVQLHRADGARQIVDDAAVQAMGARIVAALGYAGPGHIDFVRDEATGDTYAIEFNCRFWSSVEVSLWLGGNFPALAVDVARGKPIPARPTSPGYFFQAGVAGRKIRRPWELLSLGAPTWRSVAHALSDPGPLLADVARRRGWSRPRRVPSPGRGD